MARGQGTKKRMTAEEIEALIRGQKDALEKQAKKGGNVRYVYDQVRGQNITFGRTGGYINEGGGEAVPTEDSSENIKKKLKKAAKRDAENKLRGIVPPPSPGTK